MVCRCCGSELQTLSDLRLASESNFRPDGVSDPLLVLLSPCVFTSWGGGGGQSRNFHLFPVKYNLEERREHLDQNPLQKSGQKYENSNSMIPFFIEMR